MSRQRPSSVIEPSLAIDGWGFVLFLSSHQNREGKMNIPPYMRQAIIAVDLMGPMPPHRRNATLLQQAGIIGEQEQIQQGARLLRLPLALKKVAPPSATSVTASPFSAPTAKAVVGTAGNRDQPLFRCLSKMASYSAMACLSLAISRCVVSTQAVA